MRVSVQVNTDKVLKKLNQLPQHVEQEVKKAVQTSALLVEGTAKKSIQRGPKTGETYGNHIASAPGEAPATDTGTLASSVQHWIKDEGMTAEVGSYLEYAKFLEFGTVNMEPRPFLFPALESNRRAIEKMLNKAVTEGVKK